MYQPISTRDNETRLSFPTSARPSQARALSSYSFNSDGYRTLLRSSESSRTADILSLPPINDKSTVTSTTNSIAEKEDRLLHVDPSNVSHAEKAPLGTEYSIFTEAGRQSLRRKLLRSGPANPTDEPSEDGIDSNSTLVQRYTGWRAGTLVCCYAVLICIIVEAVLLIWAAKTSVGGAGSGLLYEGNCGKVRDMAIWLLLPLNIAATVLIGTGNYVMQVMTAPDRGEIDLAHSFAKAIAVGGIRFRDLRSGRGGYLRRGAWWVLGISSLPIHLLLNSAIYTSVQASNSGVLVVSDDFETDSTWDQCNSTLTGSFLSSYFACSLMQSYRAGKTRELSREQCILQYASGFQTNASSVIVVTSKDSKRWYSLQESANLPPSYGMACQSDADLNYTYTEIPSSQRTFDFDYVPEVGYASVSVGFSTHCWNDTRSNNSFTHQSWSLVPGNADLEASNYSSTDALFFTAESAMSEVESIRSLFNTLDYRYWATAQVTGDYLNKNYQTLLESWDARAWLCPRADLAGVVQCDPTQFLADATWLITPAAIPVTKCHVLPKDERCTLRYSWKILLITMFCDLIKITAMIVALRYVSKPLTTIGDVIASFLQEPDPYTKGCCLLDDDAAHTWTTSARKKMTTTVERYFALQGYEWNEGSHGLWRGYDMPVVFTQPSDLHKSSYYWLLDGGQWWTTVSPSPGGTEWFSRSKYWVQVPSMAQLYCSDVEALQIRRSPSSWTVGFSGPDPNALWTGGIMSDANSIIWVAVLINSPQVLFSMLYFIFNAILTMMHTAREWSSFTKTRKALRVSSPRGKQRSTYWLQLPWSYSLPMIAASGSLHWLLSRSVYLVKVEVYGYFGIPQADKDFFAVGYSPITVLSLGVMLGLMGVGLLTIALRRLQSGSPLVRLNSLAIAAACHPDPAETNLATEPLMWGVIKDDSGVDTTHCSFSANEVSPLREGAVYS